MLFLIKYLFLFHLIHEKAVSLEEDMQSEYPQIVTLFLLPDIETNQKTTKVCAGVTISYSHILTTANCADSIRESGPHGTIISKFTKQDPPSQRVYHLSWTYHKYFDGIKIRRDLAIAQIKDSVSPKNDNVPVSVYCDSCKYECYILGRGTFLKSIDNVEKIEEFPLRRTRIKIEREEIADGSSTDMFVTKFNKSDSTFLDLGSPLICHQEVKGRKYSAVIGIFEEVLGSSNDLFRFRSARGLLTWVSNLAMGSEISQDGHLVDARVCINTDCNAFDVAGKSANVMDRAAARTGKTAPELNGGSMCYRSQYVIFLIIISFQLIIKSY